MHIARRFIGLILILFFGLPTLFGIIWGTVAIVVLLAFGMGFKRQLSVNMHGIGESVAIMFPGRTTKPFEGFGIGSFIGCLQFDQVNPQRIRQVLL